MGTMKKRVMLLVMAVLMVVMSAGAGQTYALLVGVSNYKPGFQKNLSYPAKDAKDLKKVFDKQGFKSGLVTSSHATMSNVTERLKKIAAIAGPDDKIIYFFSGHGGPEVTCLYDGLLPYETIAQILSTSRCKHIYVMVDACHSGSADAVFRENPAYGNITFLVACSPIQLSYDGKIIDNGYMAKALVGGLRGLADANRDRCITVLELFKYVHKDVVNRSNSSQTPQLIGPTSEYQTVLTQFK